MSDYFNISIPGLTKHQMALLDIIWQFDSMEGFLDWYQTLDDTVQREVTVLQEMLLLAYIDNTVNKQQEVGVAQNILSKYTIGGKDDS